MKKIIGIFLIVIVGGIIIYYFANRNTSSEIPSPTAETPIPTISETVLSGADPYNTTYIIEGVPVTLVDGSSSVESAPGSTTTITTQVFGNEATGDLNGDGNIDTAFLITQNSGGSGTFYYIVASLQNPDGTYRGTNGVLLGDRIAPQTTQIEDATIITNYATRPEGAPMAEQPSVMVSKWLQVTGMVLSEIPQPTNQ